MIPTTTRCGSRKDGSRLSGSPCDSAASNALTLWASVITNGGFAVVSELSWLRDQAPDAVREFFASGYPDMQSMETMQEIAIFNASEDSYGYVFYVLRRT